MADFAVSTSFSAIDRVSKALGKMSAQSTKFGDRTSRAFAKASKPASRFGDILKGILGANIIRSGIGLLTRGIREVGEQFVSLDDALVSAGAKFKDVNLLTSQGRDRMKELSVAAREVGAATEFTATQAGQALDFLALANFDSQQAVASLANTVNLATIGQVDLARSTDIASDSLGAFGLMTDDADQLQRNFTRQNDVMALTMARSNTGIEDMFEAIKKGAPLFTQAGQSVETFNALIGTMAGSGIKGAEAGTSLRNVILRLVDATPEASKELQSLGIAMADETGAFRDVVDILADLESSLKGTASAQKLQSLSTIFGARTITGISVLLGAGTKNVRAFRQQLIEAGGSAETMAEIMRSSLGNQLKALQSAMLETGFKIFDAFAGKGRSAIVDFTEVVRNLDVGPLIKVLKPLITIFEVLLGVIKPIFLVVMPIAIFVLGALADFFAKIAPIMQPFLTALVVYLGVMKAIAIVQAIVAATNPFLLAVIGATLLAAGIVWLIDNWQIVEDALVQGAIRIGLFFKDLWDGIKRRFMLFVGVLVKGLAKVGSFIGLDTSGLEAFANEQIMAAVVPPNKTEIESRQTATFSGRLDIAGAPPGSTIETDTTGTANVNIALAGTNP